MLGTVLWGVVGAFRCGGLALGDPGVGLWASFPVAFLILFSQSMTLFYFINSGSTIKKAVVAQPLGEKITMAVRDVKKQTFPWITFSLLSVAGAYGLEGGLNTGTIPSFLFVLAWIATWFLLLKTSREVVRAFQTDRELRSHVQELANSLNVNN